MNSRKIMEVPVLRITLIDRKTQIKEQPKIKDTIEAVREKKWKWQGIWLEDQISNRWLNKLTG